MFFAKATDSFQRAMCFFSPMGEFWEGIHEPEKFNECRDQLVAMAKQSGFVCVASMPLYAILEEYRGDSWHYCTSRQKDWGLQAQWQRIAASCRAFSRYVATPPMASLMFETLPLAPIQ